MYCTTDEAYATTGITLSEIAEKNLGYFIKGAEAEVDRLTNMTYWKEEDSGTATSGAASTLTDSAASWTGNAYKKHYVWITGGLGSGQIRKISSNTTTALMVSAVWTTNPDSTSTYEIYYTAQDPFISEELRDGDDTIELMLNKYPLLLLESVSSNSTTLTPSSVYQYKESGKLKLSSSSEVTTWTSASSLLNSFTYYYGVKLPYMAQRLTMVYAALKALMAQAGGTHNIPSTYSLPEGSLTVGQAYINIRGAWDMLSKERDALEKTIVKYVSVY